MVLQEIPPAFEGQTPGLTARAPLPPNENRISMRAGHGVSG
jgi:hypothetical protein